MAIDVSVIIVSYHSGEYLSACVNSIYKFTHRVVFEVIIVDNGSADHALTDICDIYPSIIGLHNKANLGFASANNLGAGHATGRYLLFLNPDTILLEDSISDFFDFLEASEKQIVACGGRLQKPDGSYAVSFGHFPSLFQQFSDIGLRTFYKNFYNRRLSLSPPCNFSEPRLVDYISGADLFLLRSVFQQLNGFDEQFFMYYEDTDLLFRLQRMGYQSYILPQVAIVHHESAPENSDGTFNYNKYALLEKSKYLYFRKHHGAIAVFWSTVFQLIAVLLHYRGRYRYSLRKMMKITLS